MRAGISGSSLFFFDNEGDDVEKFVLKGDRALNRVVTAPGEMRHARQTQIELSGLRMRDDIEIAIP